MSSARRAETKIFFAGTDITSSIERYLLSLTYTDNEEDQADDLQIKLEDRDGVWLEQWLNEVLDAAADSTYAKNEEEQSSGKPYKVTAQSGITVHNRPGTQYYIYGSLAYGDAVVVKEIKDGWANIEYSGKNAYVQASFLEQGSDELSEKSDSATQSSRGLKMQAVIARRNWNGDGKDDVLECGQFELDDISLSGPPQTITLKGTALPFNSQIRQTLKSKSWEEYTLKGIASEMASKSDMACMFLSSVNPFYKRVEQYKQSDISLLKTLCHNAGCSLKVSNNIVIIFDQEEFEAKDTVSTIKPGCGYTKHSLSTTSSNKYTSCKVTYVTPEKETITATAYVKDYKADNKNNQQLEISNHKVENQAEAMELADKMLRFHNKFEFVASFTFPGNTSLVAGCTVELEGWGAWDGKYIIKQSKHTVGSSGYTTQISLRRVLYG